MKKIILLILIFKHCVSNPKEKRDVITNVKNTDTINYNAVDSSIYFINNLKTDYTIDSYDVWDNASISGELKKINYFNYNVKKINVVFYGETGKRVENYYYYSGKLMFINSKRYHYNIPNDPSHIASTDSIKIYLSNTDTTIISSTGLSNITNFIERANKYNY